MQKVLLALALVACAHSPEPRPRGTGSFTLTLIASNDVHGHLAATDGKGGLALFAGYLANVRAARARDGGAVLLIDSGDAFQGTLESNLDEGASVVRAYNVMDYDALTVGNHELDFGQPALAARAKEAKFPFLTANLLEEDSEYAPKWAKSGKLLHVKGVDVGIIGVTTIDTPIATAKQNLKGLRVVPLAPAIENQAALLRKRGATVIILAAHAGAKCEKLDNPDDFSSCDNGEIFKLAKDLKPGTVDAILAAHTHKGIAHKVNGIPIVEAFNNAVALARIDLTVDRASGRAALLKIYPPQELVPGDYEGAPVVADARVAEAVAPAINSARARRDEKLGWNVSAPVKMGYEEESALGDVIADLMLRSRPEADVAVINSGALHSDLVAGELTYGRLYDAYPFDNHVAFVKLTGAQLKKVVTRTLHGRLGVMLFAGVHAQAECVKGRLDVSLAHLDGKPIADTDRLTVVTSDFLVGGGDDFALAQLKLPPGSITIDGGELLRDGVARVLREGKGDPKLTLFDGDPKHRRMEYPGKRPVVCPDRPPAPGGGE